MATWKTPEHLEDHYGRHRGQLRCRSIEQYNASAQETIVLGMQFTYTDRGTRERRVGYYHRDTARFCGADTDGFLRTHHILDEGDVYDLLDSTYWAE
jgi:hypothetical protein